MAASLIAKEGAMFTDFYGQPGSGIQVMLASNRQSATH
jgi:hypothetical protein